jgi:DNA-binding response OmpR family regulator
MNAEREGPVPRASPRASVLIIDDDQSLAAMVADYLAGEGFQPAHANSGAQGLERIAQVPMDLVVLDIMMPGMDGLECLRRLRAAGDVPVIMLTARGEDDDRILGLELGADDYLSKPFNPRELVARIRAVLRRRTTTDPMPPLRLGPLLLDPASCSATMEGCRLRLTSAEFLVLELLARAPGQRLSRAYLTEQALGRRLEPYDRSIDTHVSNLRRKLGLSEMGALRIRSVRGAGYVLSFMTP